MVGLFCRSGDDVMTQCLAQDNIHCAHIALSDLPSEQFTKIMQEHEDPCALGNQQSLDILDMRSTTLIHVAPLRAIHAKLVEDGLYFITKSSVVLKEGTVSMRREYDSSINHADAMARGVITDHVQIGLVLDLVVFQVGTCTCD